MPLKAKRKTNQGTENAKPNIAARSKRRTLAITQKARLMADDVDALIDAQISDIDGGRTDHEEMRLMSKAVGHKLALQGMRLKAAALTKRRIDMSFFGASRTLNA